MSAPQAPAAKPATPSVSKSVDKSQKLGSTNRGPAPALVPKKAATTTGLSEAYVGARLAAFAASGAQNQRQQFPRLNTQTSRSVETSPPRGRTLHPTISPVTDVTKPAALPGTSKPPSRPIPLARSNSAIAARHASSKPGTPRQSPKPSPWRQGLSKSPSRQKEKGAISYGALSGALASMSTSPEQILAESIPSVKSRILNFEKMPVLPPTSHSQITKDAAKPRPTFKGRLRERSHSIGMLASLHSSPAGSRRSSVHSMERTLTLPTDLSRTSSRENAADHSGQLAGHYRQAVSHSPGPRRSSVTHSSAQAIPLSRSSYRNAMTVNALADAMVASSLASSRANSPAKKKKKAPPVPPRRSHSFTTLSDFKSLALSPPRRKPKKPHRPMKHTLRKHGSSEDDENELVKRGRRHWMRKHPNMHSEGDRKRWRDRVTEMERKRYEGVFAANRGLLIGPGYFIPSASALSDSTAEGNRVVNVVVRDIWERSRLPRDVLREIYDLVAPEGPHALNREQFVVGMWLIDQRLKGRKLPVKVSLDVWSSVRHTQGIKIRKRGS